jgi:hypothetical protein
MIDTIFSMWSAAVGQGYIVLTFALVIVHAFFWTIIDNWI